MDNSDDVIDSRDVIARIEELEGERDGYSVEGAEPEDPALDIERPDGTTPRETAWAAEYTDDAKELAALKALADEAEGYAADWKHGEALIRDTYFETYAEELAEDVCEMKKAQDWPFRHIDWQAAADELKQDYTSVEFDGVTYWVRA